MELIIRIRHFKSQNRTFPSIKDSVLKYQTKNTSCTDPIPSSENLDPNRSVIKFPSSRFRLDSISLILPRFILQRRTCSSGPGLGFRSSWVNSSRIVLKKKNMYFFLPLKRLFFSSSTSRVNRRFSRVPFNLYLSCND